MNEPIGTLTDIQARLAALTCPFCGHGTLELVLRCDAHSDGCLLIARCQSCRMQYVVDRETAPSSGDTSLSKGAFTQVVCPRCWSTDCIVTFRCAVASRRCAYEVVCAACWRREEKAGAE